MGNSLIKPGQPVALVYTDPAQATGLFIRATVFDVTAGYPGTIVAQIPLVNTILGSYGGLFTGANAKTYHAVIGIYLDSGFTTPDPDSPAVDYEMQGVSFTGGNIINNFGMSPALLAESGQATMAASTDAETLMTTESDQNILLISEET